jgi:uncharacterized RDD family membrane protein YckC
MSADPSSGVGTFAGFWQRVGAFLVDCVLLGAIGTVAGFFLTDEFVRLGAWGRLLGFSVAIAYFGTLNSGITGGQTLGKRLLKIKVVAKDGIPLSVPKSFLRFLPLGAPWFLNHAQLPDSALFSIWSYVVSIMIFGLGLSVVYLFVFNRPSRQSLDDLLVGSYVVAADATGPVVSAAPRRLHLVVCVLLLVAAGVIPYFTKDLAAGEPFASLIHVQRTVASVPWVVSAQVNKGKDFRAATGKGKSTITYMGIIAASRDSDIKNAARAKELAKLALSADSSAGSLDVIRVTLVYGYDIGIASSWRSQTDAHSPAEWLAE